jgi:DMSO/TMAO reductase YedYZ molybdopterin-dependent catalytic subunit
VGRGSSRECDMDGSAPTGIIKKIRGSRDAIVINFEGADEDAKKKTKFERYLSAERALSEDAIVALKMNGEELSAEHTFPGSLVVPKWYAMASVKWSSSDQSFG